MTGNRQEFIEFVVDKLSSLSGISSARFFGGQGISKDGALFAMIMGDCLYFLVDDLTRKKYQAMGATCFSYMTKKGRVDVTKYYEVTADFLDDDDKLLQLARESVAIASKTRKQKREKPR